ncbi:hypothetical protein FOMA001_g13368 [Fusarium oxysporum f. sp. matthiolae]|nr:hypothetical protein FOMA001_g13368 [Fusarium oxysporum f. sp. matthiolae]
MAPSAADTSLCTTPSCIFIASDILGNLALNYTQIDPCEDFGQYACGNFAARNGIPAGETSLNGLGLAGERVSLAARRILENPYPTGEDAGYITVNLTQAQSKVDKENFAKIQDAYQVCTNYTALEEEGLDNLAAFVRDVVSLFPATPASGQTYGKTQDHSAALGNTLAYFESIGIETLQRFIMTRNEVDPGEVKLALIPLQVAELDTPTTEEDLREYVKIASELIAAVYPSKLSITSAVKLVDSLLAFQERLKAAYQWSQEVEPPQAELPIAVGQKLAPQLNYEYVVKQLAPEGWTDALLVQNPSYFKNVSEIVSDTPAETLQAYFVWKIIISLSPYVESDLTNAYNDLYLKVSNKDAENPTPRWKRCVNFIDYGVDWVYNSDFAETTVGPTGLTWILSRFFVEKHFGPRAIKLTSELVDSIKGSFAERIETREWATSKVKKAAIEKLEAMEKLIGLPTDPNVVDPIALQNYYADIEVKSSLAINALAFAKSRVAKKWATLGKPYNRRQFDMSTLTTNAYHAVSLNQIVLLAGFQQFPLYDVDFPSYLLYGGMGSVVGHEITHGFDNKGRQFDKTGNKTIWWDEESTEAFINKTKCFVEQYNKYTVTAPNGTKVHINGELTLDENISDAGGVVSSFGAWKKWESDKGKAKNLPGLHDFTHEQLFFLKWGQTWCSNTPPETVLKKLKTNDHSPESARVMLPLKNVKGFNEAFNCQKKEPVCELW